MLNVLVQCLEIYEYTNMKCNYEYERFSVALAIKSKTHSQIVSLLFSRHIIGNNKSRGKLNIQAWQSLRITGRGENHEPRRRMRCFCH